MIGNLGIAGEPNADGEIEIGYGTYDEFRNKGFMREIVWRIIEWANTKPKVNALIASTEKENTASYKVLKKKDLLKPENLKHSYAELRIEPG